MLKAKVLGKVVEINKEGSVFTEDAAVFKELVNSFGKEVDTSQGLVSAGTGGTLETMVLLNMVDEDFEIVSGSDEARLVKRLVQEGDVLEDW